ncbi:MAG: NapC/NirT family cytochrome c [Myxococcota bacterium]
MLVVLLLVAAAIAIFLWVRLPQLMSARTGRIFLLGTLLVMPLLLVQFGVSHSLTASKTKKFCTSCHEMEVYENSLHVDDPEYIPAVHYQNRLVPRETPCYTCHTDYTLYGDVAAKWNGLHHVIVHYFEDVPKPGDIKLYSPFPNDNCLQCHRGSRKFEKAGKHISDGVTLEMLYANQKSCVSGGCHDKIHDIKNLAKQDIWGELPWPMPQELVDAAAKDKASGAQDPFAAEDPFADEPDGGATGGADAAPVPQKATDLKNVDDLWADDDAGPSPSDAAPAPSDAVQAETPDSASAPSPVPDAAPAAPVKEDAR